MKERRNHSNASTLQIALATGLISISAILIAIAASTNAKKAPRQDLYRFQPVEGARADSVTALGNYPDTLVPLSGDTTVTPDAAPTNTTSINVSTNSNFKGTFVASPATGVVTLTDAHPAGTYTLTVTAFGQGGTTTKTFVLMVTGATPCGPNLTADFINAADVNPGSAAISVAIGDFNGDGNQDLAFANSIANPGTVSIRLGDGLGGFSGSTEVSVGTAPFSVAIGDFNGDGKQDLAVAYWGSGSNPSTVSIRLGDGLGGFSGSTQVSVGIHPISVAIGDFNGDGKQDLAVANNESATVSIRLGDGLGGFSGSTEVGVDSGPQSVAIGDFNGDGKQDLAVACFGAPGTVSIRLGDGLGGFSGLTELTVGSLPISVAIGDFNGDGKQDLAVAKYSGTNPGRVSIRLGDGLGGFSGSTEVGVDSGPQSVVIGDFNGDGKQDLAVANDSGVSIRLGDGLGGFSGSSNVGVGSGPRSVAVGDFNRDGKQDLAVANNSGVSIRLGQCIPVPTPPPCPPAITQSTAQAITSGAYPCTYPHPLPGGDIQTDNSYWRAFNMGTFVGGVQYNVNSVSFGVNYANATESVSVRLYTNAGAPFPGGTRTGIASTLINVTPAQSGTVVTTPLMAVVPAGTSELVMELFTLHSPNLFVAGANTEPETGLSYWSCYNNTPQVINDHIVFSVIGSCRAAQPLNLSTRMRVQTGDNVGIGGFIITGSAPKWVILRGIGPSLTGVGVLDALADPVLELHGSTGFTTIINDNWRDTQEAEILATGLAPTNNLESAIVVTLNPGSYTVILQGKNNTSGVGLVEVYDLDQAAASKLANISTRAFVSTGSNIMIAGFILGSNSGDINLILRGIGPSLIGPGVPNALADPMLELRDTNGALIRANDNWQDDPGQAALISAAGLAPTNPLESAIAATLSPGLYTAQLAGVNNGTEVGLVEVYDRGAP